MTARARISRRDAARLGLAGGAGAPSAARRAGGSAAQRGGDKLEAFIVASAAAPRLARSVKLVRIPSGCVWRRGPRGPVPVPVPTPFDYAGAIGARGRALAFDAKRVGADAAGLNLRNAHLVKPHQIAALSAMAAGHAVAGLLVDCVRLEHILWLPADCFYPVRIVKWDDPGWVWLGTNRRAVAWDVLARHYGEPWEDGE